MNRAQYCAWRGWSKYQFDKAIAAGAPVHQRPTSRGGDYIVLSGDMVEWEIARAKAEAGGGESLEGLNAEQEKAGLLRAQRLKVEFENRVLNGEYVKVAEVEAADAIIYTALRDRIRAVTSISPILVQAALQEGESAVRRELAVALDGALEDCAAIELVSSLNNTP